MLITDNFRKAYEVKKQFNKRFFSQLYEIFLLRFLKGKLGISEYYDYKLFDNSKFTIHQKKEFAGWRVRFALQDKLNSPTHRALSTDKLIFQQIMMMSRLPIPELQAVFTRIPRYTGPVVAINSFHSLENYLSNIARFPIFVKPINSWHGRGAFGIAAYIAKDNLVRLLNETEIKLEEVYNQLCKVNAGYLLQDCLRPHSEIIKLCGNRLCTARIWVLCKQGGPVIFRALFKIAVGENMVDNTQHGETGNLYGPIDVSTGAIGRQIRRTGYHEELVTSHPDTGKPFENFILPQWDAIKELVCKASAVFPKIKLQPWDVAITESGPVLIELSLPGDIDGPQFSSEKGLWDMNIDMVLREAEY